VTTSFHFLKISDEVEVVTEDLVMSGLFLLIPVEEVQKADILIRSLWTINIGDEAMYAHTNKVVRC